MGVATVSFRRCIFDSPTFGKDGRHRAWRVVFGLEVDGVNYQDISVEVSELRDPEIKERTKSFPELHEYDGPLNFEVLRASIEFYLR